MVALRVIPSCVLCQCRRIVLPPWSYFGRGRYARKFIHQSGPCNISVSIVLLRPFLLPMFWFVVDSAVVVDFYYQELYRVCLWCNRGTDILTNVIIMSVTSTPSIAKYYCDCWTEYWVYWIYWVSCTFEFFLCIQFLLVNVYVVNLIISVEYALMMMLFLLGVCPFLMLTTIPICYV